MKKENNLVLPVNELEEFLEEKYLQYNRPEFIESDPISIPHSFRKETDIEISAFLSAIIAWGQRKTIIRNGRLLMEIMGNSPHEFITGASDLDIDAIKSFKHRTFNGNDLHYFILSLRNIYLNHGGLRSVFERLYRQERSICLTICGFREIFLSNGHPGKTSRHISNPAAGSTAKRLNMFLRWMVRKDDRGVDFGIWSNIDMKDLKIPLDVHTGNVSRKLGLLGRRQNDWKAVSELTGRLSALDPGDPVKYDFALFGLGVFEKF
jgi:uncharacterized protein (TIGR02757 family)